MTCALPRNTANEWLGIREKIGNPMILNILATSASPQTCARNLDNYRLDQQVVMVAIMLSAYAKKTCYPINDLHRFAPKDHPILRWMLNEEANCDWMKDYGIMLLLEYGIRERPAHKGAKHIYDFLEDFETPIGLDPKAFLNRAFDETFDWRHETDVFKAYRHYLNGIWTIDKKKLSWGTRMPPIWFIDEQIKQGRKEVINANPPAPAK